MPLDIQVETDPAGPVAPKRSFEELALKSARVSNGHLQYFSTVIPPCLLQAACWKGSNDSVEVISAIVILFVKIVFKEHNYIPECLKENQQTNVKFYHAIKHVCFFLSPIQSYNHVHFI